jgi:TctA family transporter
MPEVLANIGLGLQALFTSINLSACLIGVYLGLASGVLPGMSAVILMGMLLPITFGLSPITSMVLLVSIFNGAQYGASIKSIVASSEDDSSGGLSSRDGRRMAWQGQAGRALTGTLISSLFGTVFAAVFITLIAPTLASFGLSLGPTEFFSGVVLALVTTVLVSPGSISSGLAVLAFGMLLGLVGVDMDTGESRMTFGQLGLLDGIGLTPVVIGIFAIGEMIVTLEKTDRRGVVIRNITSLSPTSDDIRRMIMPILRGSVLGSVLGLLPGGGPALATYGAYATEAAVGKRGHELGQGIIEGVVGPTAANRAGTQTSFVTLLAFGIPTGSAVAMLMAALTVQGVIAGPQMITKQPELYWGMLAALWFGSVALLVIYLPLMAFWIRLIEVPFRFLFPIILGLSAVGVYSASNSATDLFAMGVFGILGYVLRKLDCSSTPFLLGFILGPLLEENFRRTMLISRGDYTVFLSRPLSAAFLIIAIVLFSNAVLPPLDRSRMET